MLVRAVTTFGTLVLNVFKVEVRCIRVVASSTGRWGRNFLDRSERRGKVGEGRRREEKRELGAERERERERIERRGRGKEREARAARGRERERSESRSEWRVRGIERAVKPGAPERVEGERDRESSETRSTGAKGREIA
ncbi:hypothetical protein MRB53_022034 [Persea americana]|uniref:Uncharacterized protein n=1 Tax=Persea americana TaxID=3435 RepID=A0ACC2L5M9_PERAE|nr:hypothetical protein MRB53_022034 [Persea americana]